MKRWENQDYRRIKETQLQSNKLKVVFENGDTVIVLINQLLPPNVKEFNQDIKYNYHEIIISTKDGDIEIPWDKIRVLTDSEFSRIVAEKAEEQAKTIGLKIKKLREQIGLKSNEVAERAGISPQTITRIEKGHTDVSFGTLKKILAAMGYTLRDLAQQEVELQSNEKSFDLLLKKLSRIGVDPKFVRARIIPSKALSALSNFKGKEPELLLDEVATYIATIFGWSKNDIWERENLEIDSQPSALAFFKKPSNANISQIKAYSHYAYFLANVAAKACNVKQQEYPSDIDEFKKNLLSKYKTFELNSLLNYIWDLGIIILPLNDAGVFHGASWNLNGRHVIVLKQNTESHAKWIFDLLHEVYHVFVHLDEENSSVVEAEEISPFSSNESMEEREANTFANQVIFGTKAEELAERCVDEAQWNLAKLKVAITKVAKEENIRTDFLANYLAFRLSYQGHNWWGTANSLQITKPNPYEIVAKFLKDRIDTKNLNPIEANVLSMAINN